jgi:DNA (cytosine-5)-methyltransferase 1
MAEPAREMFPAEEPGGPEPSADVKPNGIRRPRQRPLATEDPARPPEKRKTRGRPVRDGDGDFPDPESTVEPEPPKYLEFPEFPDFQESPGDDGQAEREDPEDLEGPRKPSAKGVPAGAPPSPGNRPVIYPRKGKAVVLFCGCGGLSLGLRRAGFRVAGAVERDAAAVSLHVKNVPNCRVWHEDLRLVSPDEIMDALKLVPGQLDLLAGSVPSRGLRSRTDVRGTATREFGTHSPEPPENAAASPGCKPEMAAGAAGPEAPQSAPLTLEQLAEMASSAPAPRPWPQSDVRWRVPSPLGPQGSDGGSETGREPPVDRPHAESAAPVAVSASSGDVPREPDAESGAKTAEALARAGESVAGIAGTGAAGNLRTGKPGAPEAPAAAHLAAAVEDQLRRQGRAMRSRPGRPSAAEEPDMVREFERFVEALLPKAILLETQWGFSRMGRFEGFRRRMARLGYGGAWRVLDLADFGVPRHSKRLVYLGTSGGAPAHVTLARGQGATVRDAIGDLGAPDPLKDKAHSTRTTDYQLKMIRAVPKDGGSLSDVPDEIRARFPRALARNSGAYGRLAWDFPAPEDSAECLDPSVSRCLHPQEDRVITLRELSLIAGLPPDLAIPDPSVGRAALAAALSGACPPAFAEAQAQALLKALAPPKPERTQARRKTKPIRPKRRWKTYLETIAKAEEDARVGLRARASAADGVADDPFVELDRPDADAGNYDAGNPDAGHFDAGNPDTGKPDTGKPDAGKDRPAGRRRKAAAVRDAGTAAGKRGGNSLGARGDRDGQFDRASAPAAGLADADFPTVSPGNDETSAAPEGKADEGLNEMAAIGKAPKASKPSRASRAKSDNASAGDGDKHRESETGAPPADGEAP